MIREGKTVNLPRHRLLRFLTPAGLSRSVEWDFDGAREEGAGAAADSGGGPPDPLGFDRNVRVLEASAPQDSRFLVEAEAIRLFSSAGTIVTGIVSSSALQGSSTKWAGKVTDVSVFLLGLLVMKLTWGGLVVVAAPIFSNRMILVICECNVSCWGDESCSLSGCDVYGLFRDKMLHLRIKNRTFPPFSSMQSCAELIETEIPLNSLLGVAYCFFVLSIWQSSCPCLHQFYSWRI